RFEHHWELDELSRMHLTFGRTKRKLESLDASTRAEFLVGVRQRLQGLAPEAFIYRGAVVCGVACRPARSMKVVETEAKSILVRSKLPDAEYVVNPYTGCVFGC